MNKWIKTLSFTTLLMGAALASASADIEVTVDGDPIRFGLAKPISTGGRVLVPLRGVFEKMGAFVQWNGATRTIDAQRDTTQVKLIIGNNYATVNGSEIKMDTSAQIVNGATMVPLRFLSESLGANVNWSAAERKIAITTDGSPSDGSNNNNSNPLVTRVVDAFTVIPVTLDTKLSSANNRKGDRFVADIDTNGDDAYAGIPEGSRIEGTVLMVKEQNGDTPGQLELGFDRIVLPNGKKVAIDGSAYSLDNKELERDSDGILVAKNKKPDNRAIYAGYGAGAGVLVGLLGNGKLDLTKALVGGLLGLLAGSLEKPKESPTDVTLKKGTAMGVRLNQSVALKL